MLSSNLVKSTSNLVSHNASFLNRCLGAVAPARGFSSAAFNVKSKFEAAYNAKMAKGATAQPHKE